MKSTNSNIMDVLGGVYMFVAFFILLFVSVALYFWLKNRLDGLRDGKDSEARKIRDHLSKRVHILRWVWMVSLIGFVITGVNQALDSRHNDEVTVTHIHGMGYSTDGQRLMIAEHNGLKLYANEEWSLGPGEHNDYMGFSVYDQGFYSSGHPPLDSALKNPFGIIRSIDEGKTIEPLAYYGQIDFHFLTAGYNSHTLYVYNPHSLKEMDQGLYHSKDEGKSWNKGSAAGISGEITAISAHPNQEAVVVIGTVEGVYLSEDAGNTFKQIITDQQITALSFSPQGMLYAGTYSEGKSGLVEMNLASSIEVQMIPIPTMVEDAVAYIAINPSSDEEITIATYKNQIYMSVDGGKAWSQIYE